MNNEGGHPFSSVCPVEERILGHERKSRNARPIKRGVGFQAVGFGTGRACLEAGVRSRGQALRMRFTASSTSLPSALAPSALRCFIATPVA